MICLLSFFESNGALDVLLDALLDSALIIPVLFLAHVLMAVIDRYAGKKTRSGLKGPLSPLIGAAAGCLPQCGFSVAATRLYTQKYIPLGALIAVYISTSDEAFLILLSSSDSAKKILPLLAIKIVYALVAGYALNFIIYLIAKNKKRKTAARGGSVLITCTAADDVDLFSYQKGAGEISEPSLKQDLSPSPDAAALSPDSTQEQNPQSDGCRCGCHSHKDGREADKWHTFVLHPFLHTLTIFAYVLAVNIVLGFIIFFVTPQRFEEFISGLSIWQPALSALVGLIPNCAAGVLLAEMYADGLLTMGAAVAGLSTAAGLGYAVLIKEHKSKLTVFLIILGMFTAGTLVGMLVDIIF